MTKFILTPVVILFAMFLTKGFSQTLTVSSSSYCTGGTGVTFGITASTTGITYFLEKQAGAVWSNVDTVSGSTGVPVYFPKIFLAGTYRLKGTIPTISVTAIILPENLYNVTVSASSGGKLVPPNGAGYCSGASSYPSIGLSGSQLGVTYKLYRNGIWHNTTSQAGNGSAISFGQVSDSGTYTVKAERNGCSRDMTGFKKIQIFSLPIVSFTPTFLGPPNLCGTVVFDTNIYYTPSYSGAPFSYTWTFPPNSNPVSSTVATPTCQFPAYGISTQAFSVLLQIVDKNGCTGTSVNNITVQQRPDATVEPLNLLWNNCNSDPTANFPLTIVNKSVTASSNTSYTIDWDDSSPLETYTPAQFPYNGQKSHTYTSKGTFHLTITASGPASPGCVDTKIFPVFNGSTPTGGLTYDPGILEGCKPHTITFFLSGNAQNNAPTTKYYFDFGDGTTPLIFFQEEIGSIPFINGKYNITHTYNEVSCSEPNQEFTLQHYIENRCSRINNTISGIKISKKSAAEFLRIEFPADPIYVCAGVSRIYTNESSPGCIIYGGSTISATNYYWDFDNNGSYEITGESPSYTFPTPGLYPVTLKSFTGESLPFNCGDSVTTRMVCVQAPPVADFTNVPSSICTTVEISPVNNSSSLPDCAIPIYLWSVTPSTGWSFTNGTSNSSFEPKITFSNPGVYSIKLEVSVMSGLSPCNTVFYEQPITVKSPPTITVNQPPSMLQCGPGPIDLSAVVTYTANNSPITNYLWTISPPGATISDPSLQYPVITIVDDATRVYTLTVSTTNECGTSVSTPITITVTQTITNNSISYAGNTDLCSGMALTSDIIGSTPLGGDGGFGYQWYMDTGAGWTQIATTQNLHYTSPLTTNPTAFKRKAISGSCVLESAPITFTVFSGIQNNVISQNQSICSGFNASTITGTLPTQGNGNYTYLWQISVDSPSFSIWNTAPGTNDSIAYKTGTLTQTTKFKRMVYSGVCELPSNVVEVTVNPIPVINSASTAIICSGVTLNYQITSNAPGSSYSWVVTDLSGGSITGASNYPSGTSTIITDVLTNNSTVPKTIQYAITPTGPPTTSCLGTVFYLTVTVRPKFNSTYSNQSISSGTTTTISGNISGGSPAYTYLWSPAAKLVTGQSTLPNPQTTILSASQNYTLTVTDAASCQFTQVVTITTTGTSLNAVISSNDADQTICEDGSITLTTTATGGGGGGVPGNYSYTWDGLPAGTTYLQPWIVQFVPANIGSNTYSVTVQDGFTSYNTSITITVNKIPSVTSGLTKQICSGEDVAYTPQSDVAGTTFNWVRGTNTCIASTPSGTTGIGSINNILTNSCNTIETINYTITPTGPAPTFCVGTPVTLAVSVDPVASITNTVASQTVVAGYSSSAVTFTSDVASAGIHWKYSNTSCPGLISFTQIQGYSSTLPSQTISLLPGAPATCALNYEVRPYLIISIGDTCWGNPFTYNFSINSEPTKYNMICPLPICAGETAIVSLSNSDIGIDYRLYRGLTNVLPVKPGTGLQLDWTGINTAGSYTIKATNTTNGQTTLMNGMCQVVLNPLPSLFILTEQNGEHCVPLTLQLSGSQLNVNYELYNNGVATGITLPGTNIPGFLVFPAVTDSGTYTVYAQNSLTGCGRFMLGSIHADPIPQEFEISPGGILCEGITLCIEHSEPGVNYQLWLGNETFGDVIPGDAQGDSICFTPCISPGVYRIHAIYPNTGCDIFFTQTVTVNPLPIQYIIAPDFGCAGAEISLNGCQAGIEYFLFFEPGGKSMMELQISGPINCNSGGSLSFGTFPDAGVYRVKAVNPATGCWSWMTGTTTLYPNPIAFEISPQQGGCPPIEIYLENFQSNAVYYLYKNGNLVGTDSGSDGQVNFGGQTEKGIYTVKAQILYANGVECWSDMNGSVEIYDSPIVYTLLPVGPLCAPVNLFLNGSQIGTTYKLWNSIQGIVQTLSGNGGFLYFAQQPYEGEYWVKAANNTTACDSTMINRVTVNKRPHVYDLLPNGPVCGTSSICLSGSEANTTYELLDENESSLSPPVFNPPTSPPNGFCFTGILPAGIYKVKAINNLTACDTVYADSVVIHHLPFVFAGEDDTICNAPPSVVLLQGDTAYCKNVLWSSTTGGVFSNPTNPTTNYTFSLLDIINKSVTLTLSAEGVGACFGTFVSDDITIQILAPNVNASPDATIGICSNYTIPATVTEPTAYTSLWSCPGNPLNEVYLSDVTLQQPIFSGAPSGNYTFRLTVTNANGCFAYDEVTITVDAATSANAGLDKSLGECTTPAQSVTLDGSGTGTGISYSWLPTTHLIGAGTATPTFGNAPAGVYTYTLIVTDAYNCTATDVVVVTVDAAPTANAGLDKTLGECITPVQSVTLDGSGTGTGISFSWLPTTHLIGAGTATPTFGNAPAGVYTYTLIVTDAYNCTATDVVVVTVDAAPTANAGLDKSLGECITPVQSVTLNGSGTGTAISYSWFPTTHLIGAGTATPTFQGAPAGVYTYTLTVTDAYNCTATDVVVVTVDAAPTANAGLDKSLGGCITPAQSVQLNGSGIGTGISYSWLPTTHLTGAGTATPTFQGAPAGVYTYTLIVTDAYNCTATDVVVVTVDAAPTANAGLDKSLGECTTPTQSVTLNGSGTGTGINYSWLPTTHLIGAGTATPTFQGAPAGIYTYTLIVTDAYNCTATDVVVVTVDAAPTANAGLDKSLGECTTPAQSVVLNGSGTGTAISYSWLPTTHLIGAGTATPTFQGAPAGVYTYTLTVTDAYNCTATDVVVVTVNEAPTANAGLDKSLGECITPAQSVQLDGSGTGTGISYSWLPTTHLIGAGTATPTFGNAPAGVYTYTLIVTDAYNCTATDVVVVTVDAAPSANAGLDKSLGECITPAQSVTLNGSGTGTGISYSWLPTTHLIGAGTATPTFQGAPAGVYTYTLIVTDAYNCTATDVVVVTVDAAPTANAGLDKSLGECITPAQSVTLNGSGTGTGISYSWLPTTHLIGAGTATPTFGNAPAGVYTYTLKVTDAYNCTATDVVVVTVDAAPTANAGLDKSLGECITPAQSVQLNGSGTGTGINYSWLPTTYLIGAGTATPTFGNAPAGVYTYTLIVTDAYNCSATDVVVVTVDAAPTANAGLDKSLGECITPAQSVVLNGSGTGTAISYSWFPTTHLIGAGTATPTFQGAPAGVYTYTLTVTDAYNCTATDVVVVTVDAAPTANAGLDKSLGECITPAQSVTLNGSGTGTAISYSWFPTTHLIGAGTATPTFQGAPAGVYTYTLIVTDAYNCTATDVVVVTVDAAPTANAGLDKSLGECITPAQSVILNGSGTGTGISYSWLPTTYLIGAGTATPTFSNAPAGVYTYTLIVTDAYNCTATDVVVVTVDAAPTANAGLDKLLGECITPAQSVTLDGSGTGTGISYSWLPTTHLIGAGTATPTFSNAPAGVYTYTLTVTDAYNCNATDVVVVTVDAAPTANAGLDKSLGECTTPAQSVTLNGSGTGTGISYSWLPTTHLIGAGTATPTFSNAPAGVYTYTLIVTDAYNCTATDVVVVTVDAAPTVSAGPAGNIGSCIGQHYQIAATTSGTGLSYSWSGVGSIYLSSRAIEDPYFNGGASGPGTYILTLTVTDVYGCVSSSNVTIVVDPRPIAIATGNATIGDCTGQATGLSGITSSGNGLSFAWSPTEYLVDPTTATPIFTGAPAGTYFVMLTVTDIHGCTSTDNVVVIVDNAPTADAGADKTIYGCSNQSITINGTGSGTNVTYAWSGTGAGYLDNQSIVAPNFTTQLNPAPGIYSLILSVTDIYGCVTTDQMQITVLAGPNANAGTDHTLCGRIPYVLNEAAANNATAYTWSTSGTGTFDNPYTVNPTYYPSSGDMVLGSVILTFCASRLPNCDDVCDNMTLTLYQKPVAFFSVPAVPSPCSNSPVFFDNQSVTTSGYINKWVWDFGDGTPNVTINHPSIPDVWHTFVGNATAFQVKLTVTTSFGCADSTTQIIYISPAPIPNFSQSSILCDNQAVQFTDQTQINGGGNIQNRSWNFGDPGSGVNNTSNSQNPVHLFTHAGTFVVTLTATNLNGCDSTVSKTIIVNQRPVSNFTADTVCLDNVTSFAYVPTGTGTIATYLWDFGDGTTPSTTGPSNAHLFATSGVFNVKLTVTNTLGCVKDTTKQVLVLAKPFANFSTSQTLCTYDSVQFTSLATTPHGFITKWVWYFGDGNSVSRIFPANPNVKHLYTSGGNYNVTLLIYTSDSCSAQVIKPINVGSSPIANFTITQNSVCELTPVHFFDNSVLNGGSQLVSWLWGFDDPNSGINNSSTDQNPYHTFTGFGTFDVSLKVTNLNGCDSTITKTITVNQRPVSNFSADTVCEGSPTSFAYIPGGTGTIVGYTWDFGDGIVSSPSQIPTTSHQYSTEGIYYAKLTVTNSLGCVKDTTKQVLVLGKPLSNFSTSQILCTSDSVQFFNLSSTPHGYIVKWKWEFGDGNEATRIFPENPNVSHLFGTGGTYNVKLTVTTSDSCTAFVIKPVNIGFAPMADFLVAQSSTCELRPVYFDDNSVLNGGSIITGWIWDFGDPLSGTANNSTQQNPEHIFMNNGTYNVTLKVTNASGCFDTITKTITIDEAPKAKFSANSACYDSLTNFVDQSVTTTGTIDSWLWDFGDPTSVANTATVPNPNHLFTEWGTYNVKLTVTNSNGCVHDTTIAVEVHPNPLAHFSTSTLNSCLNNSVQFNDLSTLPQGFINKWKWDFGVTTALNDTSVAQNPSWKYALPGVYQVKLRVTSSYGCSDSIVLPVTVFRPPTANFLYQSIPCQNGKVSFQDSSFAHQTTIVAWKWEFEPYQYSVTQNPVHVFYDMDSCYNVSLIATDFRGCIDTVVKQVCVPSALKIAFTSTETCLGDSTYFAPQLIEPTTDSLLFFDWNFNDQSSGIYNTSTKKFPSHYFAQAGTYLVSLQARDEFNCPAVVYTNVLVKPLPTATFTFNEGVCDSLVTFYKPVAVGGNIVSWLWDFGDGTDTLIKLVHPDFLSHKYSGEGFYTVKLTVKNADSCSNTITTPNVWVKPCLQAAFGLGDTLTCQNQTFAFADNSVSGTPISAWKWDFGDGDSLIYVIPKRDTVIHTYFTPGTYTVKMIIIGSVSGNLVADTTQTIVIVRPSPIADFIVTENKFCFGGKASFTNTSAENGSEINSWKWDFGEETLTSDTSTLRNPDDYLYSEHGNFMVQLIAKNGFGCKDTILKAVQVFRLPESGFESENACVGQLTVFNDKTIGFDTTITLWKWSILDTITGFVNYQTIQNAIYTFDRPGAYLVKLYSEDANKCSDSILQKVSIFTKPVSAFTYTENIDGVQGQIQFENGSTGASAYLWDFDNGQQNTHENPPVITFTEDGDYTIRLMAAADSTNCSDTSTLIFKFVFKGLYVPNAFSPGNAKESVRLLKPVGMGIKTYLFEVYDRWGNFVWSTDTVDVHGVPIEGWDGKDEGVDMPMGTYVWRATAVFRDGSVWNGHNVGIQEDKYKYVFGTFTLIR